LRPTVRWRSTTLRPVGRPASSRSGQSDPGFWSHPFTLLVCGFLLTGFLGTALTTCWQGREWDRQRRRLAREVELKQKIALFEDTTIAVAETFTSAEDILYIYQYDSGLSAKHDVEERIRYWKTESRKWRTRSKVLGAKLDATFADRRISSAFQQLVNVRRHLGNDIANLLDQLSARGLASRTTRENQQQIDDDLNLVNRTTGQGGTLRQLVSLLRAEIKAAAARKD
jgi:hypothetical protein